VGSSDKREKQCKTKDAKGPKAVFPFEFKLPMENVANIDSKVNVKAA
jgi:hypothetical protein